MVRPSLGKLTDNEAVKYGRLRDDPDYQDQLVQSLKQSRLAAFSNYTNPELTYEDIARPWRNLQLLCGVRQQMNTRLVARYG